MLVGAGDGDGVSQPPEPPSIDITLRRPGGRFCVEQTSAAKCRKLGQTRKVTENEFSRIRKSGTYIGNESTALRVD